MPNKFKIGDKVVCTKYNEYVPVGTVGIVAEDDNVPFVDWENGERFCLLEGSMELVDKAKSFKVGDRVCIATDEIEKSWKLPRGSVGTIVGLRSHGYTVRFDNWHHGHDGNLGYPDHSCLFVSASVLEPFKDSMKKGNIVIYRQGNKVIAKLTYGKSIIHTAEANCNPEDTFDFLIGSQIALQRLVEMLRGEDTVIAVPSDISFSDVFVY